MESTNENKKIQSCTTNIRGYNCKIEYIEYKKSVCTDLLSCLSHTCSGNKSDDRCELSDPDINDKTLKINLINSSNINSKDYAKYNQQMQDKQCLKEYMTLPGCNLIEEQLKDREFVQTTEALQNGKVSQSVNSKYITLDDILYCLPKTDTDLIIKLYGPELLRKPIIIEYHGYNSHMGIDKTYDAIKCINYWPSMYKEFCKYINSCITCQT